MPVMISSEMERACSTTITGMFFRAKGSVFQNVREMPSENRYNESGKGSISAERG
jgi:hypothetical protein